jgi:hypothetical protein
MDEALARELIRRKLHARRLPRSRALGIWARPGTGQACDGCGEPIAPEQQIVWGIATLDRMSIEFHDHCFEIWDSERLAVPRQESDSGTRQA